MSYKEKNIKRSQRKCKFCIQNQRMTTLFMLETMKVRRQYNNTFKVLKNLSTWNTKASESVFQKQRGNKEFSRHTIPRDHHQKSCNKKKKNAKRSP